ncbi:MAG: hypothetical protein NW237_05240 [Cyanobacteriota bacterium]|nr:hypothetical protein [Cyanobacteriota bacterium]
MVLSAFVYRSTCLATLSGLAALLIFPLASQAQAPVDRARGLRETNENSTRQFNNFEQGSTGRTAAPARGSLRDLTSNPGGASPPGSDTAVSTTGDPLPEEVLAKWHIQQNVCTGNWSTEEFAELFPLINAELVEQVCQGGS